MNCSKCKKPADGIKIVHNGKTFHFCDLCTKILESFPDHEKILDIYMQPSSKWSEEEKNIFQARKRRASGEKLWV